MKEPVTSKINRLKRELEEAEALAAQDLATQKDNLQVGSRVSWVSGMEWNAQPRIGYVISVGPTYLAVESRGAIVVREVVEKKNIAVGHIHPDGHTSVLDYVNKINDAALERMK